VNLYLLLQNNREKQTRKARQTHSAVEPVTNAYHMNEPESYNSLEKLEKVTTDNEQSRRNIRKM